LGDFAFAFNSHLDFARKARNAAEPKAPDELPEGYTLGRAENASFTLKIGDEAPFILNVTNKAQAIVYARVKAKGVLK
jgi:hypothetical protein